ncbi:thiamine pyrophosphate-dependent enzyme [Shewanella surugensis]|uniref:Thiamine pyrophosphate-dependent enzyme n=1 Tax=Shewanella surugensis TaxID=212020 RepID=A0ABT0LGE9_9GAMM|nr:thiamine pyrophosphate-dependent enzyme [Shewanella surugensis]MCL1126763.1 thiamine pyrophosphate-dependent enzyme [Shewanella surugensis]
MITEFILDLTQICFTQAGTYFNHASSGGLGWSLGAALGAKLAAPDRRVTCIIGDGTYTFGVPVATHHMSAMHDLPVLFIVLNNSAWDRTRMASRAFSNTDTANNNNKVPLCELSPSPAYEEVCQAAGGYGEKIEDPAALPAALARALAIMEKEKKQVLLNVISSKS